jgi:hypothetical protein
MQWRLAKSCIASWDSTEPNLEKESKMNPHLSKTVLFSAALATAAVSAFAVAYKKRREAGAKGGAAEAPGADIKSNIGPGEVNPYADTPTDPANQN